MSLLPTTKTETTGLDPTHLTYIGNGKYIFSAESADGTLQLWVTDGTTAGTVQLTDLHNINTIDGITITTGVAPSGFLSLGNGEFVFSGTGANGLGQLWVTNGTAAGTIELTNIKTVNQIDGDAKTTGLSPSNFISLGNGKALFEGFGANGLAQLWITNGTAAGTQQLTDVDFVNYIQGIKTTEGLSPSNFLSLGNGEIIFTGYGSNGLSQLWVTNGTAAGTHQLTQIDNVTSPLVGVFETTGLNPTGFVLLASGKALFEGTGSNGFGQLWVTDGTAAGTQQLTNVEDIAHNLGITTYSGLDPANFMSMGNGKVLFEGVGSNGLEQLWVTDGTKAGTVQLTNIDNTAHIDGINTVTGLFSAATVTPKTPGTPLTPNFVALGNGKFLFDGYGSDGLEQLWITDGTAAGTKQLTGFDDVNRIDGVTLTQGLDPTNFKLITNGLVVFEGVGSNGLDQLWVTNGTAAGTLQLTDVDYTVHFGTATVTSGLDPTGFTAGPTGTLLFSGTGSNGLTQLWTTNGTAAGTHQITNDLFMHSVVTVPA